MIPALLGGIPVRTGDWPVWPPRLPAAEQNIDRLYWHLSRIQGYAGLANFMGARFVATDAVMAPVIREAAKRGLGYLDDGSTPRSAAPALAAAAKSSRSASSASCLAARMP